MQEQHWSATPLSPGEFPVAEWAEADPEEGGSSDPPTQREAVQPDLPCRQNVAFLAHLATTSCVSSRENMKKDS